MALGRSLERLIGNAFISKHLTVRTPHKAWTGSGWCRVPDDVVTSLGRPEPDPSPSLFRCGRLDEGSAGDVYLIEVYCGYAVAIRSFANEAVKTFFERGRAGTRLGWNNVARIVARKLDMIDYAHELRDLGSPPGNRLEALKGRWRGFHSIRVNDQWRVVFRWSGLGPEDVDIVDYH